MAILIAFVAMKVKDNAILDVGKKLSKIFGDVLVVPVARPNPTLNSVSEHSFPGAVHLSVLFSCFSLYQFI